MGKENVKKIVGKILISYKTEVEGEIFSSMTAEYSYENIAYFLADCSFVKPTFERLTKFLSEDVKKPYAKPEVKYVPEVEK